MSRPSLTPSLTGRLHLIDVLHYGFARLNESSNVIRIYSSMPRHSRLHWAGEEEGGEGEGEGEEEEEQGGEKKRKRKGD